MSVIIFYNCPIDTIKIKGNIPQIDLLTVCVITVDLNRKNERSGSNGAC